MELYFQQYPDADSASPPAQTPVIIIPGLFGSTTNWRSFARDLSVHHPVLVIDQRNHGRSPQADTQTYADMAADLLAFIDRQQLDKVILCGHSMGGKTAMVFSFLHPERVAKLAVLDIAPVTYQHSHAPFLEALLTIDLSELGSRREADRALQAAIPDTATRLFLLQSLTGSPQAYRWRLNLPVLHEFMPQIVGFPDSLEGLSCGIETAFILGKLSDYVLPEYRAEIEMKFTNVEYHEVAAAGHWLHAEQPKAVLAALLEFCRK